ncbi:MAG TPA: malto-oligosyltrehalose synthase [Pyrinomonadaceae bacterium]|jgi:(1->4)-alpha-D-glucan 1-alpha-D-glucosylmutase
MDSQPVPQARIPVATYRLQFNQQFTFAQAHALVAYFDALGVSDIYSAPVLKARPGSLHGYDVVDHGQLNPEIGTEEEFAAFARELRARQLGLLMDVVPNHMNIAGSDNHWWLDVLENGPSSPYARFFDIDWQPPNPNLKNKVLLPILGDQYGRVIERQEIKLSYRGGSFYANYYETTLPVAPRTSTMILNLALADVRQRLPESDPDVLELESIITALTHLPPRTETDPARVRERRREYAVSKRRLANLVKQNGEVRHAVHEALQAMNGTKGRPATFDRLEKLLDEQAYRLSYWRVAADEINYRRFFDINELAAVRVEEQRVFHAVHEIIFRLMKQGLVTGLRVDHVDGLLNPEQYLTEVQREAAHALGAERARAAAAGGAQTVGARPAARATDRPCYIVVEKILGHDELLRREWPVHGTTGYDFMNLLNGVFVEQRNAQAFRELYADFTGGRVNFDDLLYQSKKLVLQVAMSSELHVLARKLDRISEQHRWSRDFTFNSLHGALAEVIACFPVYRTYIRRRHTSVNADDRLHITTAVRAAKRRNPALSGSLFDFIASVLLLDDPKGLTAAQKNERRDFVLRFQQLTSPVMAKGLEDTAFYRYYPLASLNEVGGEPAIFGVSVERFHRRNLDQLEAWPHTLAATATHDTKRGEDVRARINVLSEMPEEWNRALYRWRELNRARKESRDGAPVPDANEEYLLYQTLVGTWPLAPMDAEAHAAYVARLQDYMFKALKEAKLHTSWVNPEEDYEQAVRNFVAGVLAPGDANKFLADFTEFQRVPACAGMLNSLAQVLLKAAAPGVPDFYQGTELWHFCLVDPDNRRPVDYELRQRLLASLAEQPEDADATAFVQQLAAAPEDGRLKLFVTTRALRYRRAHSDLFARGDYQPLFARGSHGEHVLSFARRHDGREVVALAGRFFVGLGAARAAQLALKPELWDDTVLPLGAHFGAARYRDVLTGREFDAQDGPGGKELKLADLLAPLPVALLERL